RRRFCRTPWAGCVQQVGERQHRAGGVGRARGGGGDPGCAAAGELDRRGTRRGKAAIALSLGGASAGGGEGGVWIAGTRNRLRQPTGCHMRATTRCLHCRTKLPLIEPRPGALTATRRRREVVVLGIACGVVLTVSLTVFAILLWRVQPCSSSSRSESSSVTSKTSTPMSSVGACTAAIAAGIVKVPTVYEAAVKAVEKLTAVDKRKLLKWLQKGLDG